jgi:Tfp pilus assembly protein PilE
LGAFDSLLVCIAVGVLAGFFIPPYQRMAREAKEAMLQIGLFNLRQGVELYHAVQGRYPETLETLIRKKYAIAFRKDTFFSGEYLSAMAVDREGRLIDPFGSRYRYDDKTGVVASGTIGYEGW